MFPITLSFQILIKENGKQYTREAINSAVCRNSRKVEKSMDVRLMKFLYIQPADIYM